MRSCHATVVNCGSLTTSGSGGLSGSLTGTTYGHHATYSCTQTGYELVGTPTLTCQSNGAWSGSVPYCSRKALFNFLVHINFSVRGHTSSFNQGCHFFPCAVVNCGGLSISGTGGPGVSYPATTYGSTATYSCSWTGYELIGSSTRMCQSKGLWSGSEPYCQSKA